MIIETTAVTAINILLLIMTIVVVFRSSFRFLLSQRKKEIDRIVSLRTKRISSSDISYSDRLYTLLSSEYSYTDDSKTEPKKKKKLKNQRDKISQTKKKLPKRLQKALDRINNGTL